LRKLGKYYSLLIRDERIVKVAMHALLLHKKNFTHCLLITETAHYH